ncbi:nuclear pore complex subunit [Botrytis cinerea]
MAEQPSSSLNEIQALHSDLLALSNSRLSNLDRLAVELEAHITAFRNLLNQKNRNEQSRQSITNEIFERDGQMYKINEDFQQGTFQLADELNLDEIEASQIFFDAQDDADATGRSVLSCSIIRFHQRRKLLLDCLRLTLQQIAELEGNSEQEQELKMFLEHIIKETISSQSPTTATNINTTRNAPTFISKCISAMGDIRQWLQKISDKVSSASVLGQPSQPELLEIMEYQRHSLVKQHELLGVIVLYLVKADHSSVEDFELLLGVLKKADKYDNVLEGGSTIQDARALDKKINVKTDQNAWVLPYAHAAFRAWWLAEYSGWYVEHHDGLPHGINLEEEAKQRSQQFNEALKDGAFDFLLSLSADVKAASWTEPSRQGFRLWLQRKAPQLLSDSVSFSDFFEDQFMEQLQTFIESFITNLPDVLRKLRIDEDEQRQLSHEHEHDLDLERFIIVISYAFDGRPKAALDGFWDVPDGVLIGFMYWASRRASTPLVSAFCEMLQAISGDDECATAAHEFLLDESPQAGKMKRAHALTWNQIFKELTFFTNKLRDQPVPQAQAYRHGKPNHDQAELEPESYIMLESYLRLISQLCSHSAVARQFLMQHPSYQLTDLLFQLASSSIPSRFRAGAFTALRSLLSNKTKAAAEYLWTALDIWVSGGYVHNPSTQRNTAPPSYAPDAILRKFGTGFEEPDAFILLLHALVLPYEEDSALRDGLPFPELLGTSNRMPGIDPYVDFAVGQVVMEWMYNSSVMDAIFAAIHQDVNEVASAAPDSPSIMCLLQGIRAVTLIMDLQPTYRDIVRPLIKHQASHRRAPVPNTAYASFEDGVLNHLSIIPDLGLYCSSGNPELVIASLKLLEKLSASPRLAPAPKTGSRRIDRNKAIAALEENNAAEAISRALLQETEANIDETQGQTSDSYIIKVQILDFLIACLEACPGQTTIAHLLLGFQCRDDHLEVDTDSLFSRRISLFHSILRLANDISLEGEGNISSWLVSLRYKCLRLLKQLWHSPISSSPVMIEMRANNSFFEMFIRQTLITPGLLWDGRDLADPEFLDATSASCLSNFLNQRANVLQYTSAELRQIALSHLPSLKERMFNTLLGSTIVEEGQQVDNCSVFDLFDFMDIPLNQTIALGSLSWFKDIDVSACEEVHADLPPLFNMMKLEELLTLRRSELAALKRLENPQDVVAFNNEAQMMFNYYFIDNKLKELRAARHKALQSWVQLLLVMVETMSYDEPTKMVFVLQTLQIILPRLENCLENAADALELAKLTKALLFSLNLDSNTFKEGDLGQNLSDKLFYVFELSLRAINAVGANGSLKEIFYSISYRYLTGTSETEIPTVPETDSLDGGTYRAGRSNQPAIVPGLRKPHSTQTVKLAGDRLIDIICDDALVGEQNCRIAALLLLGALVKMAKQENSNYIIESLNRLNFISILVNSIGDLASILQETSREDSTILLSDFYARLALLVHISQTRSGATAVLNSGLFHAILASGLFALDTDLEIDFDDSEAVSRHYSLLAAIMRVICCALVSRGLQNEQSLDQGRRFLADNRAAILAVLKKSAGLGTGNDSAEQSIVDISDSFMLLMTITRFVDFEETVIHKRPTLRSFT